MLREYVRAIGLSHAYLLGGVAERAVTLILLASYTSWLSAAELGTIALLTVSVLAFSVLTTAPVTFASDRFYYDPDYADRRGELVSGLMLVVVGKSVLAFLAFRFFGPVVCARFGAAAEVAELTALYAWVLLLSAPASLLLQLLQLQERPWRYSLVMFLSGCGAAAVSLYLLIARDMGMAAVAYGEIVRLLLRAAFALPGFIPLATWTRSFRLLVRPLQFGYPQLVTGYSNFLLQVGDRYILVLMATVASVGIYNFGYQITTGIVALFTQPIQMGVQTIILRYQSEPQEQRRFIRKSTTHYYTVTMGLALLLSLFARDLVQLVSGSAEFHAAWTIVPLVAFAGVQNGLGAFLGWGLVMERRAWTMSAFTLTAALSNVLLNAALVPWMGINGAALATVLALLIWNGLRAGSSARLYELTYDWPRLIGVTALAGSCLLVGMLLTRNMEPVPAVGIRLICLSAYPLGLLLTGYLTLAERRWLLASVGRQRIN